MDREKIHELTGKPISEPADKPVPSTRSRSGPVVTRRATFHQEEPPLSAAQRDRDREREREDWSHKSAYRAAVASDQDLDLQETKCERGR